ncbi:MAG: hypothetical protein A2493_01420 [Candidatus Magasanikbacteria bacterium RIFOXYC12_FULL_33_11]|uniref:Uncharacterized protein n=1 Tax=Candidatus Magasanikbacteria bacterium RIFOXYC12_FULL_33_11 TaxID=1798701 RepID=A0A1F6NML8_9BACT|nr:MAG: hypothetical protein A2493_01420 [Candidatus Magasanikbacteria bacterium RIFOXYC12_FULL_33_11]OGH89053.1 MAG: hypothetical protein A2507_04925 [Candidatus Magasanikbacteria bacterium RIFOXYD12_FULL_33_17]HAO52702.1 hypothetical protein [Candidatus Magasanikbacteria bacterium]
MSNNYRGDGVVIGDIGIDPEHDAYSVSDDVELPESTMAGVCPHGFLPDERCRLCAGEIDAEYTNLLKTPRRK